MGHAEQLRAHTKAGEGEVVDTTQFELQTFLKYEKQLRNLKQQESRLRRYREKEGVADQWNRNPQV